MEISKDSSKVIFIDIETTGLCPGEGDRIVEIACTEMRNNLLTNNEFYHLINPQRRIPRGISAIHGIYNVGLRTKPLFSEIASNLIEFIGDTPIVMQNAAFGCGFLAAEFLRLGYSPWQVLHKNQIINALPLFRLKHPDQPCNLASLYNRYGIQLIGNEKLPNALTQTRMMSRLWIAANLRADSCQSASNSFQVTASKTIELLGLI